MLYFVRDAEVRLLEASSGTESGKAVPPPSGATALMDVTGPLWELAEIARCQIKQNIKSRTNSLT